MRRLVPEACYDTESDLEEVGRAGSISLLARVLTTSRFVRFMPVIALSLNAQAGLASDRTPETSASSSSEADATKGKKQALVGASVVLLAADNVQREHAPSSSKYLQPQRVLDPLSSSYSIQPAQHVLAGSN